MVCYPPKPFVFQLLRLLWYFWPKPDPMIGFSVLRVFSLEAVCSLGALTITHAIFGLIIIV